MEERKEDKAGKKDGGMLEWTNGLNDVADDDKEKEEKRRRRTRTSTWCPLSMDRRKDWRKE